MKACITKLRSQRGASLILAAVYFLICAFVGGTVLAAASSGGAHLKDRKADEQTFQIQRSAAQVIQSQLTVTSGYLQAEITKTKSDAGVGYTLSDGTELKDLQKLVCQGAAARYKEKNGLTSVFQDYTTGDDLVLTMSENGDGKSDTVAIHYEVGENYDLTVTISNADGISRIYVFMKASVSVRDDVTTITWDAPVLRKAGDAA